MIKVFFPDSKGFTLENNLFSGGEVNFKLSEEIKQQIQYEKSMVIIPELSNSTAFFELALLVDAVKRVSQDIELFLCIGYFPYARQDRVCNEGEALGCKVYADLINNLNFKSVIVADPHSDVVGALLNNSSVLEQHIVLSHTQHKLSNWIKEEKPLLISPDAGANKKTLKLAKEFGYDSFIRADKTRNVATGAITDTVVFDPNNEISGKDCLIVDDICDGGYTFIKLAEALKEKGANTVTLYVTHGIFSKGVKELLDNGIDKIYTTDSFRELSEEDLSTGRVFQESFY